MDLLITSPKRMNMSAVAAQKISSRRQSFSLDLKALVKVYLIDGSTKILQMQSTSKCSDVLSQLKFNLDITDISTHALFRVQGRNMRRIGLNEIITRVNIDSNDSGLEVRLLFRSWITARYGNFGHQVFQYGTRPKPSSALWIAYMEATFMTMTGKYYLSQDESILLGVLKMQAESGDFKSDVHNLNNIKERVINRFPNPVSKIMKAYLISNDSDELELSDILASKIQFLYSRISGKRKIEAQIEFLHTLQTWCPFYGSTFYNVYAQFDDNDISVNNPPVRQMNAAVGPLAIFLITLTANPIILRHPYNRILKWVANTNIFKYWVLKQNVNLYDIEQANLINPGSIDIDSYCDCVYLVSDLCEELEYLVQSYVKYNKEKIEPQLPYASGDLLPVTLPTYIENEILEIPKISSSSSEVKTNQTKPRRKSVFRKIFQSIGGTNNEEKDDIIDSNINSNKEKITLGSGIDLDNEEDNPIESGSSSYGDDTAAISTSVFRNVYKTTSKRIQSSTNIGSNIVLDFDNNDSDDNNDEMEEDNIPAGIKIAASMAELNRLASESNFSDDDDDDEVDDDDNSEKSIDDDDNDKSNELTTSQPPKGAVRRASIILFGNKSPK